MTGWRCSPSPALLLLGLAGYRLYYPAISCIYYPSEPASAQEHGCKDSVTLYLAWIGFIWPTLVLAARRAACCKRAISSRLSQQSRQPAPMSCGSKTLSDFIVNLRAASR